MESPGKPSHTWGDLQFPSVVGTTPRAQSQAGQMLTPRPGQAAHVRQEELRPGPQGTASIRAAFPDTRHQRSGQNSGQQSALFNGVHHVSRGAFTRGTEAKGTTEGEVVGWHRGLNGHEFGDGQGGLACCNPLGRKESDTTERLN